MSIADDNPQPCIRGHGIEWGETKADGRRICRICQREYLSRKAAARRVNQRRRTGTEAES